MSGTAVTGERIDVILPATTFLEGYDFAKSYGTISLDLVRPVIEPVGEAWIQFKAQYYIFALVFLVFDVEAVFLFPWAVKLGQLGLYAVIEGIIFVAILVAGLVYTWRKGMLEWA